MSNGSEQIRLGVLGSGSGSNLQAILDAIENNRLNAEIVLVLSDNPDAYILERAKKASISTDVIDCQGFATHFPDDVQKDVTEKLLSHNVDILCLAGFMRLLKQPLLDSFPDRILNIHPSLLPAYPGLMAWQQAINDGAHESGCTVHYVNVGMDTGPIILQAKVHVLPDDTAESLHTRIQEQEHQIYPQAIQLAWEKLQSTLST